MVDMENKESIINRLNELKEQNLPHMTIELFSKVNSYFANDIKDATDEERIIIEEELNPFCYVEDNSICLFCEKTPYLNWELAHGQAYDSNTGFTWNCIQYFTIKGERHKYNSSLQYHPDAYSINE